MAEIVFAAGIPHAPAIVGQFQQAPAEVREVVTRTFEETSRRLRAARPHVAIVFANDHLSNSRVRSYPDFLIGAAARHAGPHEWFKPWIGCRDYVAQGDPAVARALFRGMTRRGIRMTAKNENLNFDDNVSVPVVMTDLDRSGIRLVPVLQNCTVPPYPDQHRCYEVGRALADFVARDLPADLRVALLGSGGLSHEPGGARYYKIDEAFDRAFLAASASGDHASLLREFTPERMDAAGMGGTAEVLAWFPVMGAIGECRGESFGYSGWPSFRCGIGGVIWDLEAKRQGPRAQTAIGGAMAWDAWQKFDPNLACNDLVQDLKWDPELRALFERSEASVLDRYDLLPAERKAIEARDFRALYGLGIHPYLGGQLSRFIWGNEAGKGAVTAANNLVASLTGSREEQSKETTTWKS